MTSSGSRLSLYELFPIGSYFNSIKNTVIGVYNKWSL